MTAGRERLYELKELRRPEREAAAAVHELVRRVAREITDLRPLAAVCWSNAVQMLCGTSTVRGRPPLDRDAAALAIDRVEPHEAPGPSAVVRSYAEAMSYGASLACRPGARIGAATVLAWHGIAVAGDGDAETGRWRDVPVVVADAVTGRVGYRGLHAGRVEGCVAEVLDTARPHGDDPLVAAALAYFNLLRVHPFRDGNGRIGRAVHSVLAAWGTDLPIALASIEESFGVSNDAYDSAMVSVGGPDWEPERDPRRWVQFCLRCHLAQLDANLARIAAAAALWDRLDAATRSLVGEPARVSLLAAVLGRHLRIADREPPTGGPRSPDRAGWIDAGAAEHLGSTGWLEELRCREGSVLVATRAARTLAEDYVRIRPESTARRHFWRAEAS